MRFLIHEDNAAFKQQMVDYYNNAFHGPGVHLMRQATIEDVFLCKRHHLKGYIGRFVRTEKAKSDRFVEWVTDEDLMNPPGWMISYGLVKGKWSPKYIQQHTVSMELNNTSDKTWKSLNL